MYRLSDLPSREGMESMAIIAEQVERSLGYMGGDLAIRGLTERALLGLIWDMQVKNMNSSPTIDGLLARLNGINIGLPPASKDLLQLYVNRFESSGLIFRDSEEGYRLSFPAAMRVPHKPLLPTERPASEAPTFSMTFY